MDKQPPPEPQSGKAEESVEQGGLARFSALAKRLVGVSPSDLKKAEKCRQKNGGDKPKASA